MKNLIATLFTTIVALSCSSPEEELTFADLILSDSTPEQNQTLVIRYDGEDTFPKGYYYVFVGDKFLKKDLLFDNDGSTDLPIPESATAIIIKLKNDQVEPLFLPIYDGQKKLEKAEPSIALAKLIYGNKFGINVNREENLSVLASYFNDANISTQGQWLAKFGPNFLKRNEQASNELITKYTSRASDQSALNEHQYYDLFTVYGLVDREKSDSILQIGAEKYPKSAVAGIQKIWEMNFTQEDNIREEKFKKFIDEFGHLDDTEIQTTIEVKSYQYAVQHLYEENFEKFNYYKQFIDEIDQSGIYSSVASQFLKDDNGKLDRALDYSEKGVAFLKEHLATFTETNYGIRYTKSEYERFLKRQLNESKDIYAHALSEDGQIEKAIDVQKDLLGRSVNYSDFYVQLLEEGNNYEEILNVTPDLITEGLATDEVVERYKKAYERVRGTTEGLKENVEELEEVYYSEYRNKIKDKLIDREVDGFTLTNLDGNEVSLSDYEGKVVVLDFWSRWCKPCIAAFPGMKKVMGKFEDDDSVEFLFIDTYENPENRIEVLTDFMNNRMKFPEFHVLMDRKIGDTDIYEAAKEFNVGGIPAKFVIGPDGNIKYQSKGYGNDKDLIDEITVVVKAVQSST